MKALLAIGAIAGAIRLSTAINPGLTAVVVGLLCIAAAGYGIWTNRRCHWKGWLVSWGLVGIGLAGNVLGSIVEGGTAGSFSNPSLLPLSLTIAGDTVAIAGLVLVLHHRLPGRSVEALATATVSVFALLVPSLSLVIVPAIGWAPGTELTALSTPVLALVMLWLGASVTSLTSRNPVAYRYLLGGLFCLFIAHAATASLFLAGMSWSPVPLSAVTLWGLCLWSCAILHPSQRDVLDPIPLRSTRPRWPQMALITVAALVAPAVLAAKAILHAPGSDALLALSAALLPILVVMYLLYQVFARSAAEYRAQHDPLTGVCNRTLFDDHLEAALNEADRSGESLAVMFLDLDRFKSINDSLGHAVGNQVLQAVVQRLQSRLRPTDILARMGGDEFTILLRRITGKENAANSAERILGAFAEPVHVGDKLMPVQTSIGVAMFPEDGRDSETLLKNADTAMYQAKAAGRSTYMIYNSAMSARAELRFVLENSLRGALERGQLTVHYQPKFSTVGAELKGVEALARWRHPKLGYIPPSAFIPLAEETSLIASLGEWVLETACLQAKAWQDAGLPRLPVAVNISPRQFVRQSVVRMVEGVLSRTGLDPTLLELEVTESVLIEHMQDTAAGLAELRAMGVKCSIDDFGTGYSALTYLTDMPVDAIKIDPSFVRKIDSETGAAPIVGAVIALAHSLGLAVIAEGVETVTQMHFLSEHGCDVVQGYLFSPPVPPEEVLAFISEPPELLVAQSRGRLLAAAPAAAALLPPGRLDAVLAGIGPNGAWSEGLQRDDFLAVLTALQADDVIPIVGPRGLRFVPARMAVGTLAGLASLTGGLSAAGALPGMQTVATEILREASGINPPSTPSPGDGMSILAADSAPASGAAQDLAGVSAPPSSGGVAYAPPNPSPAQPGATGNGNPTSGDVPGAGAGGGSGSGAPGSVPGGTGGGNPGGTGSGNPGVTGGGTTGGGTGGGNGNPGGNGNGNGNPGGNGNGNGNPGGNGNGNGNPGGTGNGNPGGGSTGGGTHGKPTTDPGNSGSAVGDAKNRGHF